MRKDKEPKQLNGKRIRDLMLKIITSSQWLANQNSLFNGRLRTLLGLRLDKINIKTSLRKTALFGDGSSNLYVMPEG